MIIRPQPGLGEHNSLVATAYLSENLAQGWYVLSCFSFPHVQTNEYRHVSLTPYYDSNLPRRC
jgi:hypothetical protein